MLFKTKKARANIIKVLFESGLIVFSVLLALFLSEMHSQVKKDQEKVRALQLIKAELTTNKALLEQWRPYHQQVLANVESAITKPPEFLDSSKQRAFILSQMPNGLVQDMLRNSAWDALKQSGISSNMRIETISALNTLYRFQTLSIEATLTRLGDIFYSRESVREAYLLETLYLMRNLLQELTAQEEFMIINYQNAIKDIDKLLAE
ncbi:hypothetical protein AAEU28_04720 [Pseudoalteromonas sp. SS15]|uniref:hypothetical protein n=1 Tax=Pseudoalteromonas sp. SS15 TaxID=3139393 RepID=UPI003BA8C71A